MNDYKFRQKVKIFLLYLTTNPHKVNGILKVKYFDNFYNFSMELYLILCDKKFIKKRPLRSNFSGVKGGT